MNLRTIALAAFASVTPILAQSTQPLPVRPQYDAVRQFLTLSDAQANSLLEIQKNKQAAERAVYDQIRERQVQLDKLLQSGSNDAANIGRLMVEINNLRRQLPVSGVPYRASALGVLNDVQKAKLAQLTQALELQPAASQAVSLNLIDYPYSPGLPRILPAAAQTESATLVSEQ